MSRLFFALELPANTRQRLARLQAPLPKARRQTEQNLHLTIRFLGKQPPGCVTELQRVMAGLPIPTFELTVQGVGCFGSPQRARVLWAGVRYSPMLEALKQSVDERLLRTRLPVEEHPFRPHITLARFPRASGQIETFLAQHQTLTLNFTVQHLSLFESKLERNGQHYQVLWRTPLESQE